MDPNIQKLLQDNFDDDADDDFDEAGLESELGELLSGKAPVSKAPPSKPVAKKAANGKPNIANKKGKPPQPQNAPGGGDEDGNLIKLF